MIISSGQCTKNRVKPTTAFNTHFPSYQWRSCIVRHLIKTKPMWNMQNSQWILLIGINFIFERKWGRSLFLIYYIAVWKQSLKSAYLLKNFRNILHNPLSRDYSVTGYIKRVYITTICYISSIYVIKYYNMISQLFLFILMCYITFNTCFLIQ